MLMVIHSIAKTRMFIESIGVVKYRKIFAEALGLSVTDKMRIVGGHINHVVRGSCVHQWLGRK